jgi:hypothetical protein
MFSEGRGWQELPDVSVALASVTRSTQYLQVGQSVSPASGKRDDVVNLGFLVRAAVSASSAIPQKYAPSYRGQYGQSLRPSFRGVLVVWESAIPALGSGSLCPGEPAAAGAKQR